MRGRPNSSYLYGCEAPKDKDDFDCENKVQCPIWQCGGHLYVKIEKVKIDNDSAWQLPHIVCDDCGTVFVNSFLVQNIHGDKDTAKIERYFNRSRIGLTA